MTLELIVGLHLFANPNQPEALSALAVLCLAFLVMGLTRAWQLLGGRGHGIADAGELFRRSPDG